MSTDPYRLLRHPPCLGSPFWLQINSQSLRLLCRAAELDTKALAQIIEKSVSLSGQLLAGKANLTPPVIDRIGDRWSVRPLQPLHPEDPTPLCEFSPRSLWLMRKGKDLSQQELADQADVSCKYIQMLEQGQRTQPGLPLLQSLGKALGVRFFLL